MVEKKKAKKPQELVPLMLRLREVLRQRLAKDAEKAAKSLNAEIVDRLEASYTKDERIEELRARLGEISQRADAAQAEYEKDRNRLFEQVAEARQGIERVRAESNVRYAELDAELERERSRLEASDAVFNALVGEDVAARGAARSVALLLATNPGWAASAEGVQKMVQAASAAVAEAANKRTVLAGTVSAVVTGAVSATSGNVTIARGNVARTSEDGSTDEETFDSQGGEENEGSRQRAR